MRFFPCFSRRVFAGAALMVAWLPSLRATESEMAMRDEWVRAQVLCHPDSLVSFSYGGRDAHEVLSGAERIPTRTSDWLSGKRTHTVTWRDRATGLEVRLLATEYRDYPTIEWVAYLRNSGPAPSPVVEKLQAIDLALDVNRGGALRTIRGDDDSARSFQPLKFPLDQPRMFEPVLGRPTDTAWPYFNLDGGTSGIIAAIGWPGQWRAEFTPVAGGIKVRAGQSATRISLQPGEEIRTPLVALLFWHRADWIEAQNLWRRWFLAHNIPRVKGELPPAATMTCPPTTKPAAGEAIAGLNAYLEQGIKLDYFWVDAGWYEMEQKWYPAKGIGSWLPDPVRFPKGVREVSDHAHDRGLKFVLWFEPERVYRGSTLWNEHPEWLLKWADHDQAGVPQPERADIRLLNLGQPAARAWIAEKISGLITSEGVDIYRQDFNVRSPLEAWQLNDTSDRIGATENHYIQGYLAYWDTLLARHPRLLIDSCASGGRRNDLETMRRSVPLYRSDYQASRLSPVQPSKMTTDVFNGNQTHTYGLSLWLPFFGSGDYAGDLYSTRSHLCPWMGVAVHLDDQPDWTALRRQMADHHAVANLFYGDFFPLVDFSDEETAWMAWQFIRSDKGEGFIQGFRREHNQATRHVVKLRNLKPDAQYEFMDLDSGRRTLFAGRELMETGLELRAAAPRTAIILTFRETTRSP